VTRQAWSGIGAFWCFFLAVFIVLCLIGCDAAAESRGEELIRHTRTLEAQFGQPRSFVTVQGPLVDCAGVEACGCTGRSTVPGFHAVDTTTYSTHSRCKVIPVRRLAAHEVCHRIMAADQYSVAGEWQADWCVVNLVGVAK